MHSNQRAFPQSNEEESKSFLITCYCKTTGFNGLVTIQATKMELGTWLPSATFYAQDFQMQKN
jgi:hypothetical protein